MAKTKLKRRKKVSRLKPALAWLRARPRLLAVLAVIILYLLYLLGHNYHGWADNRKFAQTRTAIDTVYAGVAKNLGQPDNVKRTNNCFKTSGGLSSDINCSVKTEFIYGVDSEAQADVLLKHIQAEIKSTGKFKPVGKLSSAITDSLVVSTTYHGALDHYHGPHHIDCSVKYSFATPEEVDLSIHGPAARPFEVFFTCSGPANHFVYPGATG